MALRLLEAHLAEDLSEAAEATLREVGADDVWTEGGGSFGTVVRAVIGAGRTGAAIDRLHERLENVGGFRVLVLPLDAVAPRPLASASSEGREPARSSHAVSREEVYANVSDGTQLTPTYLTLTLLAATVAAIGLTEGNTAAVIGAMVVAPLLGPNVGVALGFTLGDGPLLREAARSGAAGFLVAFATALLLGLSLETDPAAPALAVRTRVELGDMILALAAGAAGTLAYTTGAPVYLVGVMVAVALLPPTVVSALLLGEGHYREAGGALLLVVANVTALTLAAMATFLWKGMRPRYWWQEERAKASARRGLVVFVMLFLALGIAVYVSRTYPAAP